MQIQFEELLKRTGSIYKLVNLASKRALQLNDGAPRLINDDETEKISTIALKEILEGKVLYKPRKKG